MEATLAPATPATADFRARLHQVIDQIQDPEMLRVVWQLLASQVSAAEPEPEITADWKAELDRRLADRTHDPAHNVPALDYLNHLMQQSA